jgi:RsiW-degrading membrane proteinase PrsW (M82 family)
MNFPSMLLGILLPALFWVGYFYYKDRRKPEPIWAAALAFLSGIAAAYFCYNSFFLLPLVGLPQDPSLIMENDRLTFLWYCLGPVGVLEELFKFLPFLSIVLMLKPFDEKIDGIIYASFIALGFAGFENFFYLPYLDGFSQIGRAIASPLTHTVFSSIWGYTVGIAHMSGKSRWKAALWGLALAAFFHGLFDFLTTSQTLRFSASAVIAVIWGWRIWTLERLGRLYKRELFKSRFRLLKLSRLAADKIKEDEQ